MTWDAPGWKKAAADYQRDRTQLPRHNLPANWHIMSVGALWHALNNPRRWPTPQSTIEAVMHCVRARGLDALKEPATRAQLLQCDARAKTEINRRIAALKGEASAAA